MTRDEAIEILMAVACCSITELSCYDCPMWNSKVQCNGWKNDEVVRAIDVLNDDIVEE